MARRSARRRTVRASSSAGGEARLARHDELARHRRCAPLGVGEERFEPARASPRRHASRRRAVGPRRRGSSASSAPTTNSSRWRRRIDGRQMRDAPAATTPAPASAPSSARDEPEGRDRLVDRAVRLGPRVVLRDAAAVQEPGRPVVTPAGRDGAGSDPDPVRLQRRVGSGHERQGRSAHHTGRRRAGSQRSASSVTLHLVLLDLLGCLLDLLDHRAGIGAERRRQDHLDLGQLVAEEDLRMSASSTTFMPISGSTTERRASRMASSRRPHRGDRSGTVATDDSTVGAEARRRSGSVQASCPHRTPAQRTSIGRPPGSVPALEAANA